MYNFNENNKINAMSDALFERLKNHGIKENFHFITEKYILDCQEFIQQLLSDVSFTLTENTYDDGFFPRIIQEYVPVNRDKKLLLIKAHQGSGKTSFIMNTFVKQTGLVNIIVEPNISNLKQLVNSYPELVLFTGETKKEKPINDFSTAVACTPEQLYTVINLLINVYHKHPNFVIFDEAHDTMNSLSQYRHMESVWKSMELALNDNLTKIIAVTATPNMIDWIAFDAVYDIEINKKNDNGTLKVISLGSEKDSKISRSDMFTKEIIDIHKETGCPLLVQIDNLTKMERIQIGLEKTGIRTLTLSNHTNKAEINIVSEYIEKYHMLPAYDRNNVKIDVILTTSTINSGVNILQNPQLGDHQYLPVVLWETENHCDIAKFQQFVCRIRYNLPETYLVHIAQGNVIRKQDNTLSLMKNEKYTRKMLSKEACVTLMNKKRFLAAKKLTAKNYSEEEYDNLTFISEMNNHSVLLNGYINFDQRMFGEEKINSLYTELQKHLNFHGYVPKTVLFSKEDRFHEYHLSNEEKKARKIKKQESAKALLENKELFSAFLKNENTEELAPVQETLGNIRRLLKAAVITGNQPDKVLTSIQNDCSKTEISNAILELEQKIANAPFNGNMNCLEAAIIAKDGIRFADDNTKEIIETVKKFRIYSDAKKIYNRLKDEDKALIYGSNEKSVNVMDVVMNIVNGADSLRELRRRANNLVIKEAYLSDENNNLDITKNNNCAIGIQIKFAVDHLFDKQTGKFIFGDGVVIPYVVLNQWGMELSSILSKTEDAKFFDESITAFEMAEILQSLVHSHIVTNNNSKSRYRKCDLVIDKNQWRHFNAALVNPQVYIQVLN